jgi:hypothetical protein
VVGHIRLFNNLSMQKPQWNRTTWRFQPVMNPSWSNEIDAASNLYHPSESEKVGRIERRLKLALFN